MAFEQNGELWKLNALLAGAMMDYGGWAWNADLGEYTPLMGPTDSADLMERAWSNILKPAEFTRVRLYEKASPPGQAPPSPYPVEAPLERWEFVDEWQENAFGLVKVAGHGDARNVYRNVWAVDYLADGQVQNPTEPIGGRTGKPKTLLPPQLQRARDLTPHPPQSGHKATQLGGSDPRLHSRWSSALQEYRLALGEEGSSQSTAGIASRTICCAYTPSAKRSVCDAATHH